MASSPMAEQYALVANISHYSKLLYILGARIPISQAKKLRLRRGSSLLGHTQLARGGSKDLTLLSLAPWSPALVQCTLKMLTV